jgi:FMN phosphatase YigB (HAD superfamily)
MTINLLLDLDGTLLDNEVNTFAAEYTRKLAMQMVCHTEPAPMVAQLLASTQEMTINNRPDHTLKDIFDATFYPSLGLKESEVRKTIEEFYREIFPTLKKQTSLKPEALELVREANQRGYRVGIATNPIFPRIAIEQRIAWSGIDITKDGISLVPSYEMFHFAKPNPAFFAEFMAQMGWPEGPVIMVGNDPTADLIPARQMGFKTFYIPEDGMPLPGTSPILTPGGNLEEVLPWIDSMTEKELLGDFSTPTAVLSTLLATPAALHTFAQELPDEAWTYCPLPGEWCLAEITCHLRDVDLEVNIPRFKKIIAEENPFIPGIDTDSWVYERGYISQDCNEALVVFIKNRMELISLLESLKPEDWQRTARHAIFGPTKLSEIVNIIAEHDRLHLQQIVKTIPK